MLPRLQAQESLIAAERAAVGSGTLKRAASEEIQRRWKRAAQGGRRRTRAQKATPDQLRAMGIAITVVPTEAPDVTP